MLSARGVSRAGAILPSFHLKQFITFANQVLIHKFLQCEILQCVLHGKTAFSGLTLLTFGTLVSFIAPLLRPIKEHRWLLILGIGWLIASVAAVFGAPKSLANHDLLQELRGPALSFALVYLSVRLT